MSVGKRGLCDLWPNLLATGRRCLGLLAVEQAQAFATTSNDTPTSAAIAPHIDAIPNAVATTKTPLVAKEIPMF